MSFELTDCQREAVEKMRNGCILNGGVGSGKSIASLAYYFKEQGGDPNDVLNEPMGDPPQDLYIITTAHKRDTQEWDIEMSRFLISRHKDEKLYYHEVVVDSWNNIGKYIDVEGAFFIFDEQRVVGKGAWVNAFLKITKRNNWILLSATPGDKYEDYLPVFLANGFFRNRTEFYENHAIYDRYTHSIKRYLNTQRLDRLCRAILVEMPVERHTIQHHIPIDCEYDRMAYRSIMKDRWNPWEQKPIETAPELCYALRKVCNSDSSRVRELIDIFNKHQKIIVFYNFDYELDILKSIDFGEGVIVNEWNGHKHEPLPEGNQWIYLVQYTAGAEGWNCIRTDTMVFWSQNYSWKTVEQSRGRIDRMNTPFTDLYYYHLRSKSAIDIGITRALDNKKKFNESRWANGRQ